MNNRLKNRTNNKAAFKAIGAALLAGSAAMLTPAALGAKDADDTEYTGRIVDEGMNRSQVQMTAHELMDRIGPRLSNSPNMRRAEAWAVAEMEALGLSSVHKEGFEFGRGWELISSDARMIFPRPLELTATAVAWTPGTEGRIEAEIIVAPMSKPEHFEAYRG